MSDSLLNLESVISSNLHDIKKIKNSLQDRNQREGAAGSTSGVSSSGNSALTNSVGEGVWQEFFNEQYQRHYYFNNETGESRWDVPPNYFDAAPPPPPPEDDVVPDSPQRNSTASTSNTFLSAPPQSYSSTIFSSRSSTSLQPQPTMRSQGSQGQGQGQGQGYELDFDPVTSASLLSAPSSNNTKDVNKKFTIADRSAQMLLQKKEKEDSMRQYLEQKELEEVKFTPAITSKSKQLHRNVTDMLNWEQQRKAKIEALQAMQEQELRSQMTGQPQVTRAAYRSGGGEGGGGSSSGVGGSGNGSGGGSGSDGVNAVPQKKVQDRLLEYEEKRRQRQQEAIQKQELDARSAAVPQVAPHSATVKREGHIVDRLYKAGAVRRDLEEEAPQSLHDYNTGQRLFQPKINKTSERLVKSRPPVAVEDLLAYKGQQYQQRAKQRELKQDIQAHMMRETPKIGANSERIVMEKMMYGELEASLEDRLSKPIGSVKARVLETIDQPTFKPTISKKSQELASGSVHVYGEAREQLDRRGVRQPQTSSSSASSSSSVSSRSNVFYAGDIAPSSQLLREYSSSHSGEYYNPEYGDGSTLRGGGGNGEQEGDGDNDDEYGYSFDNRRMDASSSSGPGPGGSGESPAIFLRSQKWAEQREARLQRERQQREQEERAKCSFKPKLDDANTFASSSSVNASSSAIPIADRQIAWAQKREAKLELERKKREAEALQECSFAPSTKVGTGKARASSADRSRRPGANSSSSSTSSVTQTARGSYGASSRSQASTSSRQQPPPPPLPATSTSSSSSSQSRNNGPSNYFHASSILNSSADSSASSMSPMYTTATTAMSNKPRIGIRSSPNGQSVMMPGWDVIGGGGGDEDMAPLDTDAWGDCSYQGPSSSRGDASRTAAAAAAGAVGAVGAPSRSSRPYTTSSIHRDDYSFPEESDAISREERLLAEEYASALALTASNQQAHVPHPAPSDYSFREEAWNEQQPSSALLYASEDTPSLMYSRDDGPSVYDLASDEFDLVNLDAIRDQADKRTRVTATAQASASALKQQQSALVPPSTLQPTGDDDDDWYDPRLEEFEAYAQSSPPGSYPPPPSSPPPPSPHPMNGLSLQRGKVSTQYTQHQPFMSPPPPPPLAPPPPSPPSLSDYQSSPSAWYSQPHSVIRPGGDPSDCSPTSSGGTSSGRGQSSRTSNRTFAFSRA